MIYLNGTPLNVTLFPDNTSQVWKIPEETFNSNKAYVEWVFSHEGEVMHLLQLQHLLTTRNHNMETTLYMRYLPYGRQDKTVNNDRSFALQTFWKAIRPFNFSKVIVVDPHNFDELRPGCAARAVYPVEELTKVVDILKPDTLCYPDKGALKKYSELPVYKMWRFIYGDKVRDQLTGNITNYQIFGDASGKSVLIIDDICDGGMTFKILAKKLLEAGAKEVNLFVTHGLFTKGLQTLKESGIKRIFTQDGEAGEMQNQITYRRL